MRRAMVVAAIVGLLLPGVSAGATALVVGPSFQGRTGRVAVQPTPDPAVAASPTQVVVVAGGGLDVHGRAGGLLRRTPLDELLGRPGATFEHGQVLYDHRGGGRWVVTGVADDVPAQAGPDLRFEDDVLHVAASRTGDARGPWAVTSVLLARHQFEDDIDTGQELVSALTGLTGDAVVVTTSIVDVDTLIPSPGLWAWSKADLYVGSPTGPRRPALPEAFPGALFDRVLAPPFVIDGATDGWFVAYPGGSPHQGELTLYRGRALGTAAAAVQLVGALPHDPPRAPAAPQPGRAPALRTPDPQGQSADGFFPGPSRPVAQVRDRLWLAETVGDGARAAVGWLEIDTTAGVIAQSGLVHASPTSHDVTPAIVANAGGSAFLIWTSTDPATGIRPQIRISGRRAGDPVGVIPAGRALQTSASPLGAATATRIDWGSTAGIALDPLATASCPYGARVVAVGEHATSRTTWGLRVSRFGLC